METLESKLLNSEELQERLDYWQNVLGLQNWQIKVIVVKDEDMPIKNTQGVCSMIEPIRSATIYILDPEDFDMEHPFNMEQIIIHELLHCKTNCYTQHLKRKSKKYLMYEQENDHLATILYNLNKKAENRDEIKESGKTSARKLKPGKPQDATK